MIRTLLAPIGLALAILAPFGWAMAQDAGEGVEVAAVVQRIKRELQAAQSVVIGEPRLELSEVTLELKAVVSRTAEGNVKISIPLWGGSAGGKASAGDTRTQTISLALAPPKPVVLQGAGADDLDVAKVIVAVRRQLAAGLKEEPVLLPRKVDFEVAFGVKAGGTASGGLKLVLFEAGTSGSYTSESEQKIILKFVAPRGP